VEAAINKAKKGKACGLDGVAAEHFIYAGNRIATLLSFLFNMCLCHNHLPMKFMCSAILPIVKDKLGSSSAKSNHRPVAIVSACSKIFELALMDLTSCYLMSSDNQFGFKRAHATDLCIFALKNTVQFYTSLNSPVFSCFLDASKAFDRVNHWVLFDKLIRRNVPLAIVRILCYWYRSQEIVVKWGNCTSKSFRVINGVRQGSILSPRLFAVYVDDLSTLLRNSSRGCFIDDACLNHFFYADDLCLLAPSPSSLQKLMNICANFGVNSDIVFNPTKSFYVVFKPPRYGLAVPPVSLNDVPINIVGCVKYLGVIIRDDLDDRDEIQKQTNIHQLLQRRWRGG
jgi:hypothetical protein